MGTVDAGDAVAGVDEARIRAVLFLCGVPPQALDDGVQQVRLKALEQPPGRVRNPAAWAATVATRVAADWHRGRSRDKRLVELLAAQPGTGAAPEDRALAVSVAAGLQRLPDEQRRLVVLRFYLDLSVRQIAEELDVPEGTVKSRLHAAVAAMRAEWRGPEVN